MICSSTRSRCWCQTQIVELVLISRAASKALEDALDCEARLPNNPNKTLISKFGLVRRTQPLLLYAGGGDRPKQLPAASASSVYGVTAWVRPKAEPKVRAARSQKAVHLAVASSAR